MQEAEYQQQATLRQRQFNEQRQRQQSNFNPDNPMLGSTFTYQNQQETEVQVETYGAIIGFIVSITILLILLLVLEYFRNNGNQCGIPLLFWLEIFFVIALSRSIFNLNIIWIVRYRYNWRIPFYIGSFLFFTALLVAWIIYGYVLYFSPDNDCQSHSDTTFWLVVMILILFVGLFIMLVFFIILCCGPCLYFYLRDQQDSRRGALDNSQIPQVISNLSRTQFDPSRFTYENKCSICLCEYEKEDQLTQLKCDVRHYFHSDCIIGWIQQGNNVCPLCRQPIEDVDNLRAMMEGGDFESFLVRRDEQRSHSQGRSSRLNGSGCSQHSSRAGPPKREKGE
uniref:RING-type domain-containing protein n=1 Tax=Strombidium rassoulzadegani TaxID=1082188 RepID=A0A7S3FZK8_9SPIT|mmetsp:Transcript_5504/g.9341  ORF Transcript_5504/g.9341 Transcript_5504/m.9341 type:complete len:338 (+) Transcript_5504:42-1055(+)